MCCLFGFMDCRHTLRAKQKNQIISALAAAAEARGINLRHIDAALVGYTFACLFAAFGLAYRYSMWLQRPPTRMHWNRGWGAFLRPGHLSISARDLAVRLVSTFALNLFIFNSPFHPSRILPTVLYFFYKNYAYVLANFWFAWYNVGSAQVWER
jgi:hypothetical protein